MLYFILLFSAGTWLLRGSPKPEGCSALLLVFFSNLYSCIYRSPSLAIVGNACGALWNISARSYVDQKTLIDLGAIPMLKNLVTSKHRLISLGSSATIKNLLACRDSAGWLIHSRAMVNRRASGKIPYALY